jgi:hypothetical protein
MAHALASSIAPFRTEDLPQFLHVHLRFPSFRRSPLARSWCMQAISGPYGCRFCHARPLRGEPRPRQRTPLTSKEIRRLALRFKRDLGFSKDGSVFITRMGKGPSARVHACPSLSAVTIFIDIEAGSLRPFGNLGVQPAQVQSVTPPELWPSVHLGSYPETLEALRRAVVLHDVMTS